MSQVANLASSALGAAIWSLGEGLGAFSIVPDLRHT
jgi:hypothetical protein